MENLKEISLTDLVVADFTQLNLSTAGSSLLLFHMR